MSIADETKKAHDAIKNKQMREQIETIARKDGVSFNEAMKRFFSGK